MLVFLAELALVSGTWSEQPHNKALPLVPCPHSFSVSMPVLHGLVGHVFGYAVLHEAEMLCNNFLANGRSIDCNEEAD